MRRRELLLGGGCAAALGAAEWLRPRQHVSLFGQAKLTQLIPTQMGDWIRAEGGDIIMPRTEGSLASTLYADQLARNYRHRDGGPLVMLLAAHGDSQSDLLQLHRPESCYPAIGFSIHERRDFPLSLAPDVTIPAVAMNARTAGRSEDLLYWTRLGEYLPTSASEQRRDRLRTAMDGFVSDWVLIRASSLRYDGPAFPRIADFLQALVGALPQAGRRALIGTGLAQRLG